jgi:hypothetical protein
MALLFIDGYPFDLVVSKGASYPGEVTEHPVDADADITDHIRNKPLELTLECVVSDTPTGEIASHPTRAERPRTRCTARQPSTSCSRFAAAASSHRRDRRGPTTTWGWCRARAARDPRERRGGALFTVALRPDDDPGEQARDRARRRPDGEGQGHGRPEAAEAVQARRSARRCVRRHLVRSGYQCVARGRVVQLADESVGVLQGHAGWSLPEGSHRGPVQALIAQTARRWSS